MVYQKQGHRIPFALGLKATPQDSWFSKRHRYTLKTHLTKDPFLLQQGWFQCRSTADFLQLTRHKRRGSRWHLLQEGCHMLENNESYKLSKTRLKASKQVNLSMIGSFYLLPTAQVQSFPSLSSFPLCSSSIGECLSPLLKHLSFSCLCSCFCRLISLYRMVISLKKTQINIRLLS